MTKLRSPMRTRGALRASLALAFLLALAPASSVVAPTPALAADNGLWSVFPTTAPDQLLARPYFQPLLSPGVLVQDSVSVTNRTDVAQNFDVYAADAFNTTEGGFALRRETDPKLDIASWIHLPVSNITVGPHSVEVVPFFIVPPVDATPGDHTGGIVALSTVPLVQHSGALNTRQLQAVGTRVYGRVVGPLTPSLAVTDIHVTAHMSAVALLGGPVNSDISYKVVNTGNVRLNPKSTLSLSPLVGPSSSAQPLVLPELLPHGSVAVHQVVNGVVPVVHMSTQVRVTSTGPTTIGEKGVWVIPWLLILIIVVIVALIVWYRRRRRKAQQGPPMHPTVQEGGQPEQLPTTPGEEAVKT